MLENIKKNFESTKEAEIIVNKQELNVEIESLREPAKEVLKQLEREINAGEYGLIIGDDASGRIPALIFDKVLKAIYEKLGYKPPKTIFFAGSGRLIGDEKEKKKEMIESYLKHLFNKEEIELGKSRVLIVSDIVSMGSSLKPLGDVLRKMGFVFDIAAMNQKLSREKSLEEFLGGRVFFPGKSRGGIYGQHALGGVKKQPENLFSTPYNRKGFYEGESGEDLAVKKVREAREDVKNLSEDLVNWYNSQSKG